MNIIENINELARKSQRKTIILVLGFVGLIAFFGWFFTPQKAPKMLADTKPKLVRMDGAADSQFSKEASQQALEGQQMEIKELHDQLRTIGEKTDFLQRLLDEKNTDDVNSSNKLVNELQTRIDELESTIHKKSGSGLGNNIGTDMAARGIATVNFSYIDESKKTTISEMAGKTKKNYVSSGTFAKAVLLSGADTNAGVHGQTDTTPIAMRILDNGTLPNGKRSSLKGCFVTAAAYGDASSERGQIRLQRLSCIKKSDGQILDIPVEGTINDMGGSDGIRGHLVMRNSKLIWNAGVAGVLSGFGSAMQQAATTQAVSPLGVTSSIKSGQALQYGAYSGANSALGKLADYYIKLADMYHPIVQVHAGSEVNIVFLKGFSLNDEEERETGDISSAEKDSDKNVQDGIPQNLMQTIQESQLGQGVDMGDGMRSEENSGEIR